ncbi:MAG TPA: ATP-dependent RNA helicase HrpA [Pirellulales bacterium]|nr:ATP-dependent RNA helicase HrpA [Pirellulales bacterium]
MLLVTMRWLDQLEAEINEAWRPDRHRLRQQWRAIAKAQRAGRPFDRNLARLTAALEQSLAMRRSRAARLPRVSYPSDLPIAQRREEILTAIDAHQVVVICGETGSGKSTQLPKICLELGRGLDGLIGHTQPRRIAARSVAARIAHELGSPLGQDVGFKIRFTDATSPNTFVKLMTDGILLAESQADRRLGHYDTLIIDEAHERSLNIDFLLGYLKRLLPSRRELKLIVTSATIDAERFARHFADIVPQVPIIEVSGRAWPVEVRYRPPLAADDASEPDMIQAVLAAVEEASEHGSGDILIFMPTEQDIHATAKALRGHLAPGNPIRQEIEIVPLYARLAGAQQNRVFQVHRGRRIVIATNVAESSLTVPGIRYVIDTGTARISRYSSRQKVQRLPIEPISRASADQRQGRCGRVGPGVCLRLYGEAEYHSREAYTPPEIQRSNLAAVILQAKSLGFGRLEDFPFLDPPRPESVRDGYQTLFELGAIDERQELTALGRSLARLPVDPRIGRMILAGVDEGCLEQILVIAAALAVQDPRDRPNEREQAADESHARWADEKSDFLGYLKLWDFYHELKSQLSGNRLRQACQHNFLSFNRMREWLDVHRQLLKIALPSGLAARRQTADYDAIHRALLVGLLSSVALRSDRHQYTVAGGLKALLWPGSAALEKRPKWVVAAETVETNRRYLRTVGRISPGWIEALAPHLVKRTYSEPHWDPTVGSALVFEQVTLFGLPVVRRRRTRLAPLDPTHARHLLIGHGLVRGGYQVRARFLEHNRELVAELDELQRRSRRHDFLRSAEARYEFYDARIGPEVCDGPAFERWRRQAEQQNRRVLFMQPEDLLTQPAAPVGKSQFPDTITIGRMGLPLEYRFAPGTQHDGLTVTVPQAVFGQLDPVRMEWLVPGWLEEKVTALLRSLPKSVRTRFVPAPDVAHQVAGQLHFGEGSLSTALARGLSVMSGEMVRAEMFRPDRVPEHLKMRVCVVDSAGRTLAAGRDLRQLRHRLLAEHAQDFARLKHSQWRREGLTAWEFPDLPEQVEIGRRGTKLLAFPAIVDRGSTVALELCPSPAVAQSASRAGLRRLFVLGSERQLQTQVEWLPNLQQLLLYASPLLAADEFRTQLAELMADRAFLGDDPLPRTADDFRARRQQAEERIAGAVQEVLPLLSSLLECFHRARLAVEEATNWQWRYAVVDVRGQLEELFRPTFLTNTPWQWLQHYPRYLRAIVERFRRLAAGELAGDSERFERLGPHWEAYRELARQPRTERAADPQLESFRWLVEEYRVALFAERLGTAVQVSEELLEEQWLKVEKF